MTDERELNDGLAAFDQLGREMAETNRLLRAVRSDQATRNQQEQALSAEMKTALKQATGASQKALQAAQAEMRSSILWTGLTALPARSGGVWRGICLWPAGWMGHRARERIPESPKSGSRRKLGQHPIRTESLWPRSTWKPRYAGSVQREWLDHGTPERSDGLFSETGRQREPEWLVYSLTVTGMRKPVSPSLFPELFSLARFCWRYRIRASAERERRSPPVGRRIKP